MTTKTQTRKPVTVAELDNALKALRDVRWIVPHGRAQSLSAVEVSQISDGLRDGIAVLLRIRRGAKVEG